MMIFLQKLIAKVLNSKLVFSNPFIDVEKIVHRINNENVNRCLNQVTLGKSSRFYELAKVFNFQNNLEGIKIGENTHIRGELLLFKYGGNLSIGNYCYIGEGSRIWSGDNISIGNNVLISHNVNVMDTNSHEIDHLIRAERYKNLLINGHPEVKEPIETAPIVIEDFVWVSFNVTILKGVRIGEGAIIGAGSVVIKDVPAFTLVAGNPARVIKNLK